MHNITSDQRAIPDLSYTCKWLSSLFPGKIFISVHFSGSQSLRKKNLILRFPVNLTSGIYFCLCWWKWSENENDMNLHQKTMSHYCSPWFLASTRVSPGGWDTSSDWDSESMVGRASFSIAFHVNSIH